MFSIDRVDIPRGVLISFWEYCGDYDSRISMKRFVENKRAVLEEYHGSVDNGVYTFDTEEHYQWFLLRWT